MDRCIGRMRMMQRSQNQDFHITILDLGVLDHECQTFYYYGFDRWLSDVEGHVIRELMTNCESCGD